MAVHLGSLSWSTDLLPDLQLIASIDQWYDNSALSLTTKRLSWRFSSGNYVSATFIYWGIVYMMLKLSLMIRIAVGMLALASLDTLTKLRRISQGMETSFGRRVLGALLGMWVSDPSLRSKR